MNPFLIPCFAFDWNRNICGFVYSWNSGSCCWRSQTYLKNKKGPVNFPEPFYSTLCCSAEKRSKLLNSKISVHPQGFTVESWFGSWDIHLGVGAVLKCLESSEHYLTSLWSWWVGSFDLFHSVQALNAFSFSCWCFWSWSISWSLTAASWSFFPQILHFNGVFCKTTCVYIDF